MKRPSYPKAPKAFVSRNDAAAMLRCSLRTVSRYQSSGRLRFERCQGRTRIYKEDVVAMARPGTSVRLDNQRIRRMAARVMMLELQLSEVLEAMDAQLESKESTPYEQPEEF